MTKQQLKKPVGARKAKLPDLSILRSQRLLENLRLVMKGHKCNAGWRPRDRRCPLAKVFTDKL